CDGSTTPAYTAWRPSGVPGGNVSLVVTVTGTDPSPSNSDSTWSSSVSTRVTPTIWYVYERCQSKFVSRYEVRSAAGNCATTVTAGRPPVPIVDRRILYLYSARSNGEVGIVAGCHDTTIASAVTSAFNSAGGGIDGARKTVCAFEGPALRP